jgi:hypothetical protein
VTVWRKICAIVKMDVDFMPVVFGDSKLCCAITVCFKGASFNVTFNTLRLLCGVFAGILFAAIVTRGFGGWRLTPVHVTPRCLLAGATCHPSDVSSPGSCLCLASGL